MEFISITNDVRVAKLFEESGINSVMVDLEIMGKKERQKGMNTVISAHSIQDVLRVKDVLVNADCLVRVNPIHGRSKEEIDKVIEYGADIIMLPMFKAAEEVQIFVDLIGDKARKYLLLETSQALARVDDILAVPGIDAIHIGLNDLSISMGLDFLYEPLIGGIVEYLASKITSRGLRFGIGGASRLEKSRLIFSEHVRLGSDMVIINRDFRNYADSYEAIVQNVSLKDEISKVVDYLETMKYASKTTLEANRHKLIIEIKEQIEYMRLHDPLSSCFRT